MEKRDFPTQRRLANRRAGLSARRLGVRPYGETSMAFTGTTAGWPISLNKESVNSFVLAWKKVGWAASGGDMLAGLSAENWLSGSNAAGSEPRRSEKTTPLITTATAAAPKLAAKAGRVSKKAHKLCNHSDESCHCPRSPARSRVMTRPENSLK